MMEAPRCGFTVRDNGSIETDRSVAYKISGTSIAGIVGKSAWDTPFTVACKLLGLYIENIDDKPAVKTGTVLEPVILKHFDCIPAESVFGERTGDHCDWKPDFEDEVFTGHIDGMTKEGRIVEVKTSSNPLAWLKGVPENYHLQASLYSHFLDEGRDVSFLVGFVDQADYADPYSWDVASKTLRFDVAVHPSIERYIEYARNWWHDHIEQGITPTPDMNDPRDVRVLQWLKQCASGEDELIRTLDAIADLQDVISEAEQEIKAKEKDLDTLKADLKDQMRIRGMTSVSGHRVQATISKSNRDSFDIPKARADGVDVDRYITRKVVETMRFKTI